VALQAGRELLFARRFSVPLAEFGQRRKALAAVRARTWMLSGPWQDSQ
jgi:hypothetical protein